MKKGHAYLPLHYGTVPTCLGEIMTLLGGAIVNIIVYEYGRRTFLQK